MVYFVIPNLNGENYLKDCLQTVFYQSIKKLKVIVVDNGSSDNSINIIEKFFPGVVLIKNGENLGYAEGANITQ